MVFTIDNDGLIRYMGDQQDTCFIQKVLDRLRGSPSGMTNRGSYAVSFEAMELLDSRELLERYLIEGNESEDGWCTWHGGSEATKAFPFDAREHRRTIGMVNT